MSERNTGRVPPAPGYSGSAPSPSVSASGECPSRGGASLLRRLTLCRLSLCETFKTASDDKGIWGECQKCGKRVGYVDRRALREIGRREFDRHWESNHG